MSHLIVVTDDGNWTDIDPFMTEAFVARISDGLYALLREKRAYPEEIADSPELHCIGYLDEIAQEVNSCAESHSPMNLDLYREDEDASELG